MVSGYAYAFFYFNLVLSKITAYWRGTIQHHTCRRQYRQNCLQTNM